MQLKDLPLRVQNAPAVNCHFLPQFSSLRPDCRDSYIWQVCQSYAFWVDFGWCPLR